MEPQSPSANDDVWSILGFHVDFRVSMMVSRPSSRPSRRFLRLPVHALGRPLRSLLLSSSEVDEDRGMACGNWYERPRREPDSSGFTGFVFRSLKLDACCATRRDGEIHGQMRRQTMATRPSSCSEHFLLGDLPNSGMSCDLLSDIQTDRGMKKAWSPSWTGRWTERLEASRFDGV